VSEATLLVELLTEELPPNSLKELSEVFATKLLLELQRDRFLADRSTVRAFATPRRLAALITMVHDHSPDSERDVQGPPLSAPAQAVAGFARKYGVAIEALRKAQTPKGEVYVAHVLTPGRPLEDVLFAQVEAALKALPIQKLMRWGDGEAQFVRPVHGLVMLHGTRVVPGTVLGVAAGGTTHGHRFMGAGSIALASAEEYEARLRDDGMVIADFAVRRDEIERQLRAQAGRLGASLGEYADLLDEVTALVEHPSVYVGAFDAGFLEVPQECLILTMRKNQKYFPLFDTDGRLLPKFLIVSNMRVADPSNIVGGNQRVIRPRLEDARFFYDQDRKQRLEARVPLLAKVVYHHKLGSQRERVDRLKLLAGTIAGSIGADRAQAERAAELSKADLLTGMVGEFPELQGIMGSYYAKNDGEPAAVVKALADQYHLRFEDAPTAQNLVSACLYLADRLDALVGMFGIGLEPTGESDPFALRRAALGVISVFELLGASTATAGRKLPDVVEFLQQAKNQFPKGVLAGAATDQVHAFILERYWNSLATLYPKDVVDAVISQRPRLAEVNARVRAVQEFRKLPEAESLAAANKRIRNILVKSPPPSDHEFSESLFVERPEKDLYAAFRSVDARAASELSKGGFGAALAALAALKAPVDAFFDKVMVNVEDQALRNNRLMLLQRLDAALNRVADISRLGA
jgi:glycyl-tRNA synthetase beta chain